MLVAEARVAGGRAEEKNFLARSPNQFREWRKDFSQPGAAGKNKFFRAQRRAITQFDSGEFAARNFGGSYRGLAILAVLGDESLHHGFTGQARSEVSGFRLQIHTVDVLEIDLRIAFAGGV